jgi:tRNA threonylcarbamoyladenosine dehydratase
LLNAFSRMEMLVGKDAMKKLSNSKVLVFGIGGVGSYAVEGLVRAGVGKFVLVDDDFVGLTNINRQIHANINTIGKPKVEVMKERILEINPKAEVITHQVFICQERRMI